MATARLEQDEIDAGASKEELNSNLRGGNVISLRGRNVERNETDPDCRSKIGPWGSRSSSEPRTGRAEQRRTSGEMGENEIYCVVNVDDVLKLMGGNAKGGDCIWDEEGKKKEELEAKQGETIWSAECECQGGCIQPYAHSQFRQVHPNTHQCAPQLLRIMQIPLEKYC